ncbi:uncharacterized protein LOC141657185 [Silene latifolia]|uniref:uncharacterized protein LOC141657185 n=1 Tax=Silene latifolia TaxID=37657 RepID=UPI003D76ECDC
MAKFNEVQKRRRAIISQTKRNIEGDPVSRKIKRPTQLQSVSGKRQRKNLKKWRRDQKEAVEKGLISLQDVEMASADGSSKDTKKTSTKFLVKKSVKLRTKSRKSKGKKNQGESSKPGVEATPVDAMVE